ncbi:MAG TPA: site-2 protease family protein [Ilumatobacteraceae bacterium]
MFRLLGFDVRVGMGFVLFVAIIVLLYGDGFGLWLALSLAAFTLVHELGHALAARRHGARASITLEFFHGYTSFVPTRPLTRRQRMLISFAGPGVHIAVGVLALAIMGVSPLTRPAAGETDAAQAVWWAGPLIGVLNLVPVLPLDGGHLVQTAIEPLAGRKAHRYMVIASLVLTSAAAVWLALDLERRGMVIFVAFLLLAQIRMLTAATDGRRRTDRVIRQHSAAADAETAAWETGRSGVLVPGQDLSPWYRAHRAHLQGRDDEARQILLDDLLSQGPRRWWPPDAATPAQLRALVSLLPSPPPVGNPGSTTALAEILLRIGERLPAGAYAADAYSRSRSAADALVVARAAAGLGDRETALKWLRAALSSANASAPLVAATIDGAPELAWLRADPEVARLRDQLTGA